MWQMDRTSILGDTIDYMKELLERISNLQQEIDQAGPTTQLNVMGLTKDGKPNDILVRNSPKVPCNSDYSTQHCHFKPKENFTQLNQSIETDMTLFIFIFF